MILHLQKCWKGSLRDQISALWSISSLRGIWDSLQAKLTWYTLDCRTSKGHFHLLWQGFCGACKGFCPNCNLFISAFPSFSQVCLLSYRLHKFAGISLSQNSLPLYQIVLKGGKQIQKTFGETEGEKKFRNANTLSLSFQTGMITHSVFVFLPHNGSRGQCLW